MADIGAFSFFISSKPSRARLQRTTFILWLGGIARRVPVRSAVRSHDRKATGGGSRSASWDTTRSAFQIATISCASTIALRSASARRFRTPRSRMLPSVIGGPGGCRCCAITIPRRACGRTNIATKTGPGTSESRDPAGDETTAGFFLRRDPRVGQRPRAAAPLAWACGGAWGKGWIHGLATQFVWVNSRAFSIHCS